MKKVITRRLPAVQRRLADPVLSTAHYHLSAAVVTSLISMGTASLLGIAAWHVCQHWPWPLQLDLKFYLLHIFFASLYSILWTLSTLVLDSLRRGTNLVWDLWRSPFLGWQLLMGVWLYGL